MRHAYVRAAAVSGMHATAQSSVAAPSQDVKEEKMVTTRSGLKYVDKRIGKGAPVQPGQLLILDYRCGHSSMPCATMRQHEHASGGPQYGHAAPHQRTAALHCKSCTEAQAKVCGARAGRRQMGRYLRTQRSVESPSCSSTGRGRSRVAYAGAWRRRSAACGQVGHAVPCRHARGTQGHTALPYMPAAGSTTGITVLIIGLRDVCLSPP